MHYLIEVKENEPFYNEEFKYVKRALPIQLEYQSERYAYVLNLNCSTNC